jgi:ATP-dependent Clp protease ATP-binding subunit ClpC
VSTLPPEGKELELEIKQLVRDKEQAIRNQEFEKASDLRDLEQTKRDSLRDMADAFKKEQEKFKVSVTEEHIAHIVSQWTGVPVSKLTESEGEKLLKMEDILHQQVIGQHDAVVAISKAIRRARVGLKNPSRPIGSFIFSGPTGVGKTELAKALAGYFFGSEDSMIRVDMSEYMERHTVSKLIGSPPGYVGFNDGGQLTEAVRRKPYSVVLFDEVEKAHPDVFNTLLQILDDGRLTDSKGRTVDFKNTIIIMTSNVGARGIENPTPFGFASKSSDADRYAKMKDTVLDELKQVFRPEFLNRLDDTIIFQQLSKDEIRQIVDLMAKDLFGRLAQQRLRLTLSDEVKDELAKEGYSPSYGARPLRRVIQKRIEDPLCEELLNNRFKEGDVIQAELKPLDEPAEATTADDGDTQKKKVVRDVLFTHAGTVPLEEFDEEIRNMQRKGSNKPSSTSITSGGSSSSGGGTGRKSGGGGGTKLKELEA